nr:MAG TPA: hypothetical protein [Bacteriophage sp.]
MANETVLFKRGDSATITSAPVIDGQILFDTSGNGKMYLDNGTDRLEMGGAITVDASLSKTSTNAIQNKAVTGNILNSLAEVSAATQQNTIAGALALKEVNSSLVSDIYVGDDGKLHKVVGGADTVLPFSSGASGTLTIGFNFEVRMNTQDGTYGNRANNNGTATIKLKDGVVTSRSITGSGWGETVSAAAVAYRANVSSFSITSVNWTPD